VCFGAAIWGGDNVPPARIVNFAGSRTLVAGAVAAEVRDVVAGTAALDALVWVPAAV
jgi:hypothetical protein